MNQAQLNRAVASATGETVATVKRLGFLLAEFDDADHRSDADDAQQQVIDWDQLAGNQTTRPHERASRETAAC